MEKKILFYNHQTIVGKVLSKNEYYFGLSWLCRNYSLGTIEPVINVIRDVSKRNPRAAYEVSYDIASAIKETEGETTTIGPLLRISDEILKEDYERQTNIFNKSEYLRLIGLLID